MSFALFIKTFFFYKITNSKVIEDLRDFSEIQMIINSFYNLQISLRVF